MNPHLSQFIRKLPEETLTLIRGNTPVLRNGDVYYPFRQDSDFLYLTGLNIPGLVLTIQIPPHPLAPSPSEKRDGTGTPSPSGEGRGEAIIVWREPITEHDTIWGSDKLSDDEMRKISGIEDIRDITELREYCLRHQSLSFGVYEESAPEIRATGRIFPLSAGQKHDKNQVWQSIIHELRTVKTSEEIAKIQNCIRITETIYQEILEKVQAGMYEYEIEAIIAYGFRRHHGTEAFPTIVASGTNSCTLHYTKNEKKIQTGDIVLIDFGIELGGYGADISRTFAVGGFSSRQQEIYDAVKDVKKFAEKTLKPGITRRAWNLGVKEYMYEVCQNLSLKNIEKYTPTTNPYYPHSIGHFLGLDTHDVGNSDLPLLPGMILTIEPGIYIPSESIGIRIEDDYLVTESSCVKL